MDDLTTDRRRAVRVSAVQFAILIALCLLAFRTQVAALLDLAVYDRESAHLLVAPLLMGLLVYLRRDALAGALGRGSPWGFVLIVMAMALYGIAKWFTYAYPQRVAIMIAVTGVVLAVGGWRFLRLSIPMLLILLLAVPMTPRHYARMIILPETLTLQAVRATLDLLPGVFVDLEGSDLTFLGDGRRGAIALGEPYRGASLLLAYLTIGVFVAGSRIRPLWQQAGIAVAAVPIMLACNYARLVMWGLWTIWTGAAPLDPWPRLVSTPLSLVLAYALFAATAWTLARMLRPEDPAPDTYGRASTQSP